MKSKSDGFVRISSFSERLGLGPSALGRKLRRKEFPEVQFRCARPNGREIEVTYKGKKWLEDYHARWVVRDKAIAQLKKAGSTLERAAAIINSNPKVEAVVGGKAEIDRRGRSVYFSASGVEALSTYFAQFYPANVVEKELRDVGLNCELAPALKAGKFAGVAYAVSPVDKLGKKYDYVVVHRRSLVDSVKRLLETHYDRKTALQLAGIHVSTLHRWVAAGFPQVGLTHDQIFYPKEGFEQWVAQFKRPKGKGNGKLRQPRTSNTGPVGKTGKTVLLANTRLAELGICDAGALAATRMFLTRFPQHSSPTLERASRLQDPATGKPHQSAVEHYLGALAYLGGPESTQGAAFNASLDLAFAGRKSQIQLKQDRAAQPRLNLFIARCKRVLEPK